MKRLTCKIVVAAAVLLAAAPLISSAQVGVNTTNPDTTALLDIHFSGTGQVGVLLPNLNKKERGERLNVVSDGMLVFDRYEKLLYYYDGKIKQWVALNSLGSKSTLNGLEDIRPQNDSVNKFLNMSLGLDTGEVATAKLDVKGNVRVRGNMKVDGSNTVGQNLIINGTTTLKQSLQVDGSTTLQSPTTINNTLTVTNSINAGSNTITAGTINATTLNGNGAIPIGGIIMWSGKAVPLGWALCDGRSTSQGYKTPDLRGRFIVGYGESGTGLPANVWNTYTNPGNLSQKGASVGETGGEMKHTLTESEMPKHHHGSGAVYAGHRAVDDGGGLQTYYTGVRVDFPAPANSSWTNDVGGGSSHENRPPYYVLAFIMRVQ